MNKEAVDNIAKGLNIDFDKYKADVDAAEVNSNLDELSNLAQKIQVNGVPTVIINGKHVQTMRAEDLQAAIDEAK